ncbi:MAG: tetratricopeptide repeat protein [Elusimicrobiales bacterium]
MSSSAKRDAIIVASAAALVYCASMRGSFHLDDFAHIVDNPAIQSLSNPAAVLGYFPSRALAFAAFAANYAVNGFNAAGWHIANIALHMAASLLCLLLVRRLAPPAALPCALYFAVHPLQTEAVAYIYQRSAILAALFYMAAIYLYFGFRDANDRRKLAGSLLCALAAYFSKENSLSLPAAVAAAELIYFSGDGKTALKRAAPYMLLWLPALWAVAHSGTFVDIEKLRGRQAAAPLEYFASQPFVLLQYLRLAVFPAGQCLLHDIKPAGGLLSARFLLPAAAITALACAAFARFKNNKAAVFGLSWFFITLFIESGFIPLQDLMFEHRMYLPIMGLALFFVAASDEIFGPRRIIHFALIAALGITAFARTLVWSGEFSLWADNAAKSPRLPAPYNNLGAAYLDSGNNEQARLLFEKSIGADPHFGQAWNNMGLALYRLGRKEEARAAFQKAALLGPDRDDALNNLGNMLFAGGDYAGAAAQYRLALGFNPRNRKAARNLALAGRKMAK